MAAQLPQALDGPRPAPPGPQPCNDAYCMADGDHAPCGQLDLPWTAFATRWNPQASQWPVRVLRLPDGRVMACLGPWRLHSVFQPIFSADGRQVLAHEALLRAWDDQGRPMAPPRLFELAEAERDLMFLDRLCRMLHVINFERQAPPAGHQLYLNMDARYLPAVTQPTGQHYMDQLLAQCAIPPERVTLEITESRIDDRDGLARAVGSLVERRFRIAIDDFGARDSNFDRLWLLSPHVVKLDRSLILLADRDPRVQRLLPKVIDIAHDLDALVICEGIETARQHELAALAATDQVQGYFHATPHHRLRSTP